MKAFLTGLLVFQFSMHASAAAARTEVTFLAYFQQTDSLLLQESARLWFAVQEDSLFGPSQKRIGQKINIKGSWHGQYSSDSEIVLGKSGELFAVSHDPTYSFYQIGRYDQQALSASEDCVVRATFFEEFRVFSRLERVPFYPRSKHQVLNIWQQAGEIDMFDRITYDEGLSGSNPDYLLPATSVSGCTAAYLSQNFGAT